MIRFGCGQCGATFKVSDDKGGKRAKCPHCTAVLTIPAAPPPEVQEIGEYRLADEVGLYIVLFPIHKIHMVAWWRRGLLLGAGLSKKVFALLGILVVLFYISFDVIYTVLRVQTGTAHWAHLGGLIAGMVLALLLLVSRLVHTGGDGLSLLLGRYAWALVGTPIAHARRRAR